MSQTRQILGRWGEELAGGFLIERGYTILATNVRTPYGEIDLIVRQPGEAGDHLDSPEVTVFVEVKTRSSTAYGYPEEAVTARKQAHLLGAAQHYLQEHPEVGGDWRIDVIAIERSRVGKPPVIYHFENAVH
ncbi:MAG TPA: YraN family protein [Anaerolineales bacterium]|jgi:putative endonuclease|nr:YraN family protein [Anaerolineales bacterium]